MDDSGLGVSLVDVPSLEDFPRFVSFLFFLLNSLLFYGVNFQEYF